MKKQGLRKVQNVAHKWWHSDLNLGLIPKTKFLTIILDYFASEFEEHALGGWRLLLSTSGQILES